MTEAAVDYRAKWRAQVFCQRQNLGAGGIHFRRACKKLRGPLRGSPEGNYGGPAKEAVEQQIANIRAFVGEREQ